LGKGVELFKVSGAGQIYAIRGHAVLADKAQALTTASLKYQAFMFAEMGELTGCQIS